MPNIEEISVSDDGPASEKEGLYLKTRISALWGARSVTYDNAFGHGFCDETHRTLWRSALESNARPREGLRVLDVGCGTGFLSLLLADLGCTVTGVDLAPDMLARARAKAEAARLSITFRDGDAESPPFGPETFDLIVCRHVVWTLPDPEAAFRNWHRILVPGGRVMPVEGTWTPRTLWEHLCVGLANVMERLVPTPNYDPGWQVHYPGNSTNLPFFGGPRAKILAAALERAGYEILCVDRLEDVVAHERAHAPLGRKPYFWPGRRYIVVGQKR
ncbi:class I SAM-dependent methyltransferase [Shumkonia mesophila]|uniref:class I SAM-dependent methyltransferase n=1 Tax=Shumkonia mesophila TaxID=2838854 RepID=UPI0029347A28|nr:class I SAM-dependent methyltransferase [Shumkonia mesophila]